MHRLTWRGSRPGVDLNESPSACFLASSHNSKNWFLVKPFREQHLCLPAARTQNRASFSNCFVFSPPPRIELTMKCVGLHFVCLALSIPSVAAAVAGKISSGRLGGTNSAAKVPTAIQAEKVTSDEAAAAKSAVARSLEQSTPSFFTQPGEWWDPSVWDPSPYFATCDAGFVTCCNGFEGECDANGEPTSDTTCHDACANGAGGYDCCRNDSGDGDVNACLLFTGRVCRDGSYSEGFNACFKANVGEIINGCQGRFACDSVAHPKTANAVPRIHNSCRSREKACFKLAGEGGSVGNVLNSCNTNPDAAATDHLTLAPIDTVPERDMYTRQCVLVGWKGGKVKDMVHSCGGGWQVCYALGSVNSEVGNVFNSCTNPDSTTGASPYGYKGCWADTHGSGPMGDIVDSCHDTGHGSCVYIDKGIANPSRNIVRSCIGTASCYGMAREGIVGDVYDSCVGTASCRYLAMAMPHEVGPVSNGLIPKEESGVGDIIGSCRGEHVCEDLARNNAFGDIVGSCLEDYGCHKLANQNDDISLRDTSLSCCENESQATTDTCDAASPVDTTLCSIGDASTLASYCGSDSCPVGAARPASPSAGTGADTGGASDGGTASTGESDAASYVGETQTLDEATIKTAEAAEAVDEFFTARSAYEIATHNLEVATTQLEDATTAHAEAQAKATALTKKYDQVVAYEATMKTAFDDATARAEATDATAAERYRLPIEAEIAYKEATAVKVEAEEAKNAAVDEEQAALQTKNRAAATKAQATAAKDEAKTVLDAELAEVNANLLIPKINPTTLDFPYVDTDGDLIPNDFDACPTQMGLRRNTDDRTSSVNPGPQDFCPSGCPETGADGTTILDSDGDGINDCEDRCPFEAGIEYNHDWTFATKDDFSSLQRNLDYHGCPDRDGDGIPDKFDACPTQAGGECYSGCPDKGTDPVTGKAYDGDMDGVSDCDDRCPGFYGPGSTDGCPDGDFDGTPDYRDYCPSNPGDALFDYQRKLEGNAQKYMNILGCPDEDGDLVTDQADICDAPAYPNQDAATFTGLTRVAVVNNKGCPLDSDQDGVYDGIDNCDGTVHSDNPVHDPRAIVFSPTDDGFTAADDETKLGCPKDTDNDGVADGIDQCPTEGGYIGRNGCPIDSDNDGVKDCISTDAPASYTWPFQPTGCHSTEAKPVDAATCCTVEQDMCADTVRGATVYAEEYTNDKLDAPVAPGCPFDTDKDGVVDGVDLCPYTTDVEIALAASNPNKVSIDDSGCATMSAAMWESTFVDVTTGSEGANPKVELLFTVDALLPQVATSRKYDVANELVAVQVMDASCTNTFDDETDAGDKLLPATVIVNNKGLFTGQTPTGSIPITIDLNLNPDNVVGSEVWTTEPPFDVGSIDFCLGFAVLSDTKKFVTYEELKTTILIDMTQDFAVTDISVERNEAEETTKLIDIEYPLAACQCTTDNVCVEDSNLDDSFLSQSDSLKLCVRFAPDADNGDVLPPDYVHQSFTCNQGGLSISPIVNFERQGDGGQLTSVDTINKELGSGESYTDDDRMLIVSTRLPATFFGAEERPVDCVGTIVYEFAAGSVIDPSLVGTDRQRLLYDASVPLTSGQTNRRDAEETPEAEAESEFSVEVMLAKAAAGRSVGVIAGAAVASALVVASGAAVTTMTIRRPGSGGVPKFVNGQPSTQQQSWAETSASTQEEGRAFPITNGAVA